MSNVNYKDEYKAFFYVDNTMPTIRPEGYDPMNKILALHGANVRIGPALGDKGKITQLAILTTCGIYMRVKDIKDSHTPRRNLSLEQAMTEMEKVF
ncbi:MAG: hypothetical protein AABW51_04795 [Nanoarchaeota archaeon]